MLAYGIGYLYWWVLVTRLPLLCCYNQFFNAHHLYNFIAFTWLLLDMETTMEQKIKANKLLQAMRTAYSNPLIIGAICSSAIMLPHAAFAQEPPEEPSEQTEITEVIEVQGARQTIQSSIAIKREATEIVDGISAADIGDLPALSIGEALETLTGASSHRDQGGATEISIRGLGPYLGSTVMNGREAANGSGDRSVNFSQFPSELFEKVAIYKTQSAEFIEGGVSGQIHLDTLKPLDYGKRRFQLDLKGNYNPDNDNLQDPNNRIGKRITASFVDQYESDRFGEIGLSIGYQNDARSNPEQEARTGTSFFACRIDPSFGDGINSPRTDCEDNGGALDLVADASGIAPDQDTPFVFARSQNSFRQNITDDDRESIFASVQWLPNEMIEVNLDYQSSERDFNEVRSDLVFAEVNHLDGFTTTDADRLPFDLVATANGGLRQFTATQNIETNSQFAERIEEFEGFGVNLIYIANDRLTLSFDLSSSSTDRTENILQTRLQSEDVDIFGNDVLGADNNGEVRTASQILFDGASVPTWTLENFDVNYHAAFADQARTRLDINQSRFNEINALRGDVEYLYDWRAITAIKAGFRLSSLEYRAVPGGSGTNNRNEFTFSDEAAASANQACRNNAFPEADFFDEETGGRPLITNVDSDGNIIAAGTGNTFASFDALCLAENLLNSLTDEDGNMRTIANSFPVNDQDDIQDIRSVDVTEDTFAAYIQADYDTYVGDYGVRGNFGVRIVKTEVDSISFRGPLIANRDPDTGLISDISPSPDLERVSGGGDYTELLPSATLIVDVNDDVMVRSALYRGLSRPDPSDLGFGRNFLGVDEDEDTGEIEDILARASAVGNPFLDPFLSWNADLAVEWYPNEDTILALGLYYKRFDGGFENGSQTEIFEVDGVPLETIVTAPQTSDDASTIFGLELTATHSFAYLDNWLNGFGFKLSYNYANSDFEFEDEFFGSSSVINPSNGEVTEVVGIVPPANLFGFSENVLFGQLYYEYEGFNAALNYKYRSNYFQQFLNTPGAIRYVDDTEVWEFKASYRYNRNWKFSVAAINIFDEPRKQYRPSPDNFSELNVYGPRIFATVNYRY